MTDPEQPAQLPPSAASAAPSPNPSTGRSAGRVGGVPLPRWTVPVVAVVVLAVAVVTGWVMWRWIDDLALADAAQKDKATAQLDAVKFAASIAVGGGGLFALYLAARRQRTQELELAARHAELAQRDRVQDDTRADAEARRITELYTKASEQLGSDKAPVRLAGLYALERLAQDSPPQRPTVVNLLCAYLRMPFTLPGEQPDDDADEQIRTTHRERVQEREVRLTAQRILAIHLNPGPKPSDSVETFWPHTDLDLAGATLIDFDLESCHIGKALFGGSSFAGTARFDGARFTGSVWFDRASFTGDALFVQASFAGDASFGGSSFAGDASFGGARFAGNASFGGSSFTGTASFGGARFTGSTWFGGARFLGDTWFVDASFATSASFPRASFAGNNSFTRAAFAGTASFDETRFTGASFDKVSFTGTAVFASARFTGHVSFDKASFAGGAWFGGTSFPTDVPSSTVHFTDALAADTAHHSVWPAGLRLSDKHVAAAGREGIWRRLVRVPELTTSSEAATPQT